MRKLTPFTGNQIANQSPFSLMDRMMNEMMKDFWAPEVSKDASWAHAIQGVVNVRVNLSETDDAYHVQAELPGLTEKEIKLSLEDGLLTLQGEKSARREEKNDYHLVECSYGSFRRQVHLPKAVDESKVSASFKNGILSIDLPKDKTGANKRKEIPILGQ